MLSPGAGTKMSSDFFQIRGGGDIAAMTSIAKVVLARDDKAKQVGAPRVLDTAFFSGRPAVRLRRRSQRT